MKKGDFVKIEYVAKVGDEVFDLTDENLAKELGIWNENTRYGPVPIIVGEGMVIEGVDEALLDMEVGQEKVFEVPPEKAFGHRRPELVRVVPLSSLDFRPQPGMLIESEYGVGKILSVTSGRVTIDFNNPLVGKTLLYRLKVVGKIEDPEEKIRTILDYFGAEYEIRGKKVVVRNAGNKEKIMFLAGKYTDYEIEFAKDGE